jgi:hypothetical protein
VWKGLIGKELCNALGAKSDKRAQERERERERERIVPKREKWERRRGKVGMGGVGNKNSRGGMA